MDIIPIPNERPAVSRPHINTNFSVIKEAIETLQEDGPSTGGLTDDELRAAPVPVLGPLTDAELRASAVPVSIGAMALPTGASTAALQVTGNTSLASIDTKTPALASGRVPVDGSGVTQPVSLAASVAVTGPLTDTQLRATAVPVSIGAFSLPTGASTSALQTTGNTSLGSIDGKLPSLASGRVPVDGSGVTQPVSGIVAVTGTFFQATQPVSISGSVPVTGGLTDTQLRATRVPVDGSGVTQPVSGTFFQATQPVSGTVALDATALAAISAAAPAGSEIIGKVGIDQTTPGTTNAVAAILRTNAKGTTTAADVTSSAASANRQTLDVGNYDPATGNASLWRPDSSPYVASEPTTLLFDNFESLDTTDVWTTSGSNAPTVSLGTLSFPTGTTALATSFLQSKNSFGLPSTVFLRSGMLVSLLSTAETGSKAIFGIGIPAGSPTVALPLTNGVVFETDDTTGALVGVVYSNSVRGTPVALTRPTDGSLHRYAIFYRSSRVYFEIDGVSGAAASIAFPNPAISKLPATIGLVNGAATLGAQRTFASSLMSIADTGRNNTQISDGLLPWRKGTVKPASTPAAQTDTAFVVDTREGSIAGQGSQTALGNNIVNAVAGTGVTDCAGYRSIALQIVPAAGTFTAGAITFEGSNDSTFTSSTPIPLYDAASLTANPITSYTIVAATNRFFAGPLLFRYFRARISTGVTGTTTGVQAFTRINPEQYYSTQQTVVQATGANLNAAISAGTITTVSTLSNTTALTPGVAAANLGKAEDAVAASADTGIFVLGVRRDTLVISASATGDYNELATDSYGSVQTREYEKQAKTYSSAALIALAASATDVFTITGSATTTVFITRLSISATATAATVVNILLMKRSTADTAGTSAGATAIPHDSSDAAATATCLSYSANPTTGTSVGVIRDIHISASTTAGPAPITTFDFGDKGRPVILRGIAQVLAINLNGATVTGGQMAAWIEWFEI